MNKKSLKIIFIFAMVLLVVAALFLLFYNLDSEQKPGLNQKAEIMNSEEKIKAGLNRKIIYEVTSRSSDGEVESYKMIGIEDEKPIDIEFMNEDEKAQFGLMTDKKIQILSRNSQGEIVAYKIIKADEDILNRY